MTVEVTDCVDVVVVVVKVVAGTIVVVAGLVTLTAVSKHNFLKKGDVRNSGTCHVSNGRR